MDDPSIKRERLKDGWNIQLQRSKERLKQNGGVDNDQANSGFCKKYIRTYLQKVGLNSW